MQRNFIIKFFSELSEQINKIDTPIFTGFLKQVTTVLGITLFFSAFFFGISYIWIKCIIFIYNMGH